MAVVDVDQARNDLSEMVDRVQDGERITITSRSCNAVLISEEDYNSLLETIRLLSDPDMAADLDRTRGTPLTDGGLDTAMSNWQTWKDCETTVRSAIF